MFNKKLILFFNYDVHKTIPFFYMAGCLHV